LPLFGNIIDGAMQLNEFGHIAEKEWLMAPDRRSYIALHEFIVMPNHFHGIIEILDMGIPPENGVARYARTDKANACDVRIGNAMADISPKCRTLSTIIRAYKSAVSRAIRMLGGIPTTIWQRNYYEHIVRNEDDYVQISEYIKYNPLKWIDDRFYM